MLEQLADYMPALSANGGVISLRTNSNLQVVTGSTLLRVPKMAVGLQVERYELAVFSRYGALSLASSSIVVVVVEVVVLVVLVAAAVVVVVKQQQQ